MTAQQERPRLLIYDVGYGPRPDWYLPILCPRYDIRVLWTASGITSRDETRAAAFAAWCDHLPLPDRASARERLLDFASQWRPAGITTFGEFAVTDVHEVANALQLPANDPRSVPALRDKYEQRRLLTAAGVPVPRFALVRTLAELTTALESVGLPAVLKPTAGAGSMAAFPLDSRTDLTAIWHAACQAYLGDSRSDGRTHFILEERLQGRRVHSDPRYGHQVSVESIVADGVVTHLAVADKLVLAPPFREIGDFLPSTLPAELVAEIREMAGAAIAAMHLTNSAMQTELMLTADGPRIIEVNSRVGGGVPEMLQYAYDFDVISAIAAIATRQPVEPCGPPRRFAGFLTPQAPLPPRALTRVPDLDDLRQWPGVVDVRVNYAVGDVPDPADGTRGGTLARIMARADRQADLLDLADQLAAAFEYATDPEPCQQVAQ